MAVLEAGSGSEVTESGRASPAKELLGGSAGGGLSAEREFILLLLSSLYYILLAETS